MRNWLDKFSHDSLVVSGKGVQWTASDLQQKIAQVSLALSNRRRPDAPVALLADNCPEWIAIDLATQALGLTLIPLPGFFTPEQWNHAIETSGAQGLFCANASLAQALGFRQHCAYEGDLSLHEKGTDPTLSTTDDRDELGRRDTQKITFTSGTTSTPKGVCLSTTQQWDVADALAQALSHLQIKRHLNLLPFSVLLENIAGVYTTLLSGAENICLPLADVGLHGATRFDPQVCLDAIAQHQAQSIIVLPQMLQALAHACQLNDPRIASLKFMAVGGAKTPVELIHEARRKGLPVYEGYGLSECSSVVALNVPGRDRVGSVGQPLSNRQVRIADDGEIMISGHGSARYLGEAPHDSAWWPSGDLGRIDEAGFLYVEGRKKNILITGFGRNVSPEWPETALLGTGKFLQAVVMGESRPYLCALLVPIDPQLSTDAICAEVAKVNRKLPDYAEIGAWLLADAPLTTSNGLATANGRIKRAAVSAVYEAKMNQLYESIPEKDAVAE